MRCKSHIWTTQRHQKSQHSSQGILRSPLSHKDRRNLSSATFTQAAGMVLCTRSRVQPVGDRDRSAQGVEAAQEAQPLSPAPWGSPSPVWGHSPQLRQRHSRRRREWSAIRKESRKEREEKEKNEFSCCPSGVAIDRVQAGVERC